MGQFGPVKGGDTPRVSIGMPVYNGERHVSEALDSLLAQSFEDFELVISDNASTDRTAEICQERAARDGRIRYVRNRENIGPVANFNQVLSLARGEYFMWAAHDDRWHRTYIESCLAGYALDPSLVLVSSVAQLVDPATGRRIGIDPGISTVGLRPAERFRRYKLTLDTWTHYSTIYYGLYRRSVLLRATPVRNIIAGDQVVLARLCFLGSFHTVPETLFVKRFRGASVGFEFAAAAMGITSPAAIAFTILWRELAFQRMIRDAEGLSAFERLRLGAWSWLIYLQRHKASGVRTWLRLWRGSHRAYS